MVIANPWQSAVRSAYGKHRFAGSGQIVDQLIDRCGGLVVRPEQEDRSVRCDRSGRPVLQFSGAVAERGNAQNLGDLQRDLAGSPEPIASRGDKRGPRPRNALAPSSASRRVRKMFG